MNEEKIEQLLQKAPRIAAPAGLLRELQAEITLPRESAGQPNGFDPQSWLKRWLPALSFAAFFLTCLVVLGVQANTLAALKQQNAELRAAAGNLEQLRLANAEYQRLQAGSQELERLRADSADARRLRGEVASLRAQLPEIDKLRAENQKLQAAGLARAPQLGVAADDDFFAKAERIRCVNNLKQIGLAGRIWAGDNKDILPPDFLNMTNELVTASILQCPSDKAHHVADWSSVAGGNISYQMLGPGVTESSDPRTVFVICPVHNNICLIDGSVQQLTPAQMQQCLKVVDGRTVYIP